MSPPQYAALLFFGDGATRNGRLRRAPNTVLARFNDREGAAQVVEGMRIEHASQFLMHSVLGTGRDSEKQNACRVSTGEHEAAKVAVPRQQKAVPIGGFPKEPAIWRPGQVKVGGRYHVVPVRLQKVEGDRPYVVVGKKGHEAGADT